MRKTVSKELMDEEDMEFVHDCLLDKICISNQCSNAQRLCCVECIQFYHPNHPEKIQDYLYSYKQLKRSIKDKKITINKETSKISEQNNGNEKFRKMMSKQVEQSFKKINTYCTNLISTEIKVLQNRFDIIFDQNNFKILSDITQASLSSDQQQKKLQLIEYANKIFSKYESETHPYLQFKNKHEVQFLEETKNHFDDMKKHIQDVTTKLKRKVKKIVQLSRSVSSTILIDLQHCDVDSKKIEIFDSPISQMFPLNKNILIISMKLDVPRQYLAFVDYTEDYDVVNTLYIPHQKVVDLKSSGTFLVVQDFKIIKIRYSPSGIKIIKSLVFCERIVQVECIFETNSVIVITKGLEEIDTTLKFNFYRVNDLSIYKRYKTLDQSKTLILAYSQQINTLVTADQRHLKVYKLISGRFQQYFLFGDTLNDNIIDIKFQKQLQKEKKDYLMISNIQGLVTKILFPNLKKKVINKKSTNQTDKVSFCIMEELKLFNKMMYMQFIVKSNNTNLDIVKIRKNQTKTNQNQTIYQQFELAEEYTCHCSYSTVGIPSTFNLFIGTAKGALFHLTYQGKNQ